MPAQVGAAVLRQTIIRKGPVAPRWLTVFVALALCGSAAAIAWQRRLATWDDAYIYARTVRNVLDGRGWSFNPDRKLDVCTSPLYFGVLLGTSVALRNPDYIPHAAAALYGATLASTALLIFLGLERRTGWVMAFLAAAGFLHHPYIETLNGVETLLLLTCCLGALWTYARKQYVWAAFLLGLAVLARGDAVLLAMLVLAHYVLARKRFPGPAVLAAFLVPLLAWMAMHVVQFGSVFPETLSAKMAQGRTGMWNTFEDGLEISFMQNRPRPIIRANRAAAIAAIAGLVIAVARRDAAVALLGLFAAAHFGAYTLLGIPYYHWYYGPEYLAAWILIAVCLSVGFRLAADRGHLRTEGGLAVIGWAAMATLVVMCCELTRRHPYKRVDASLVQGYFHLSDKIRPLLQQGDSVLVTEVGALGWALPEQTIEDTVGLTGFVRPDELRSGQVNAWLTRTEDLPDHVLVVDRFASRMLNGDPAVTLRFDDHYEPELRVDDVAGDPAGDYRTTVFRRRPEPRGPDPARPVSLLPMIRPEQFEPPAVMMYCIADGGRVYPSLFQHPPHELSIELDVSKRYLVFGYGLMPGVYQASDGVAFRILVQDDDERTTVFEQTVRPRDEEADRQWRHAVVDLRPYVGRRVRLTFATGTLEEPTHDQCAWLSPRLADEPAR